MENVAHKLIQDEVIEDMEKRFGWKVESVTPNKKGYGNLCWITDTDNGSLFIKKYDKVRNRRGLGGIRQALQYQDLMHHHGIPCQPVFSYKGEYIHTTLSGEEYMISGVSAGEHIEAGAANADQMFNLGEATGRMHQWMKSHIPPSDALQWKLPPKANMLNRLEKNLEETVTAGHERYANAIEKQRSILNRLDLELLKQSDHALRIFFLTLNSKTTQAAGYAR